MELSTASPSNIMEQTTTDQHLVELWLHGRSPHIQRAHRADVERFLAFVATPLASVRFARHCTLDGLRPVRRLVAVYTQDGPLNPLPEPPSRVDLHLTRHLANGET